MTQKHPTEILAGLVAFLVTLPIGVSEIHAQQPQKFTRIGLLDLAKPEATSTRNESFRQGLRDLSYIEGRNIVIEYRSAQEKPERLPELAAELVRLKPNVIVAQNTVVSRVLAAATSTIAIVNAGGGDLVNSKLAASLARPGGNVTGLTSLTLDLNVKRLELLKETLPRLSRVAVLPSPTTRPRSRVVKELQAVAPSLRLALQILNLNTADDLPGAFDAAAKRRAGALIGLPDGTGIFLANMKQISALAERTKLPTMFPSSLYVDAGGLLSYAPNDRAMWQRAATYVDKILKGTRPADLPVEQPMKFEFAINLKAAKQIGVTIPPNVLVRADRVIR